MVAVERLGLPVVYLGVVSWAAWKLIGSRDKTIKTLSDSLEKAHTDHKTEVDQVHKSYQAELKRVNDLRVADGNSSKNELLDIVKEFNENTSELTEVMRAVESSQRPPPNRRTR